MTGNSTLTYPLLVLVLGCETRRDETAAVSNGSANDEDDEEDK